jgi:hypothetical protein
VGFFTSTEIGEDPASFFDAVTLPPNTSFYYPYA